MNSAIEIANVFHRVFGSRPFLVAHAGGRVNIIGEHTDYHEGLVFPAAIDKRTFAAGLLRHDGILRIWSENIRTEFVCKLDELAPGGFSGHARYLLGPFWALREAGFYLPGADVAVLGEVPLGGGLSSSASLQVALVALGVGLCGQSLPRMEVARLARRSENEFCGVPCGAMDQIAAACGGEGQALLIDCRTFEWETVGFPKGWAIVVADSGVKHEVAGQEYRKRQEECSEGLNVIRDFYPLVKTARDLTLDMLEDMRHKLPKKAFFRLRHVVTENARVLRAKEAMLEEDALVMGNLLYRSHDSLAVDYEVSCEELDALVDIASGLQGVIGARLCGAGFGGNTINLVFEEYADGFCASLADKASVRLGRKIRVERVRPAQGVVVGEAG